MTWFIIACILLLPYAIRFRFRKRTHKLGTGVWL